MVNMPVSLRIKGAISRTHIFPRTLLGFSSVKNLPAMQEMPDTRVQSLRQEDPLEEGMATHSSILGGKIPWTEEPGGLQSMGHKVRHD